VQTGDLNGQNKWIASSAGAALVQTNTVYAGNQALELNTGTNAAVEVRHDFVAYGENIVWLDFYTKVKRGAPAADVSDTAASFYFDHTGCLVVYDGLESGTNKWVTLSSQATTGSWARLSVKLDYSAQLWSVCLNGADAASALGFASARTEFTSFTMEGKKGFADSITISTNAPADLDVDWDNLPNTWEQTYFGCLDSGDDDDPDGDGLTNLQEYLYGTDPTIDDTTADDDGDGLSNYSELIVYGTDPSLADSDGDGMNDGDEVSAGKNPAVADQGDAGGPALTVQSPADGEYVL